MEPDRSEPVDDGGVRTVPHAVGVADRAHEGGDARLRRRVEGCEVDLLLGAGRHEDVDRAPVGLLDVRPEVLRHGELTGLLDRLDEPRPERRREHGILTEVLEAPSPVVVDRDVEAGALDPHRALGARLVAEVGAVLVGEPTIERGGEVELRGERRAHPPPPRRRPRGRRAGSAAGCRAEGRRGSPLRSGARAPAGARGTRSSRRGSSAGRPAMPWRRAVGHSPRRGPRGTGGTASGWPRRVSRSPPSLPARGGRRAQATTARPAGG